MKKRFQFAFAAALGLIVLSSFGGAAVTLASQIDTATVGDSLLSNGNFETDANSDGWPDGFKSEELVHGLYRGYYLRPTKEEDNRFLRLISPGLVKVGVIVEEKEYTLAKAIRIPVGTETIILKWRQRITKRQDAKLLKGNIRVYFSDSEKADVLYEVLDRWGTNTKSDVVNQDTNGWQNCNMTISVPKDKGYVIISPSITGGTFDLDDVSLTVGKVSQERVKTAEDSKRASDKLKFIFDKTAKNLPPSFVGNDMSLLIPLLSNGDIEAREEGKIKGKDEFEKTEVYLRRVNLAVAEKLGLQEKWTDKSSFVSTLNDRKYLSKYDADKEELVVGLSFLSEFPFELYDPTEEGPVSFKMSWKNIEQFPHGIHRGSGYYPSKIWLDDVNLKMSSSVAKQVMPHLSLLFSFRLNSHYRNNGREIRDVAVNEIWIFNSQTGEIYKKLLAQRQ